MGVEDANHHEIAFVFPGWQKREREREGKVEIMTSINEICMEFN